MKTEYKKYRIIYTFKHSKMGFNNSITITAMNVDLAINEAKDQVSGVYGSKMLKRFTFENDLTFKNQYNEKQN